MRTSATSFYAFPTTTFPTTTFPTTCYPVARYDTSVSDPARAWLVKTEPEEYSFEMLARTAHARWDGVRNFEARNHLRAMQSGDLVLVYHSGRRREIVGLARVHTPAYPDPSDPRGQFVCVDLAAIRPLGVPVSLVAVKSEPRLSSMLLLRRGRLSVQPVLAAELAVVLELGGVESRV